MGRLASEEVVLKLIATKCVPIILYGLDACPVNASDKHSLDFVLTRCIMKLFNTGSINVIRDCMNMFNVKNLSDCVNIRKTVFLSRYCKSANIVELFQTLLVMNYCRLGVCNFFFFYNCHCGECNLVWSPFPLLSLYYYRYAFSYLICLQLLL